MTTFFAYNWKQNCTKQFTINIDYTVFYMVSNQLLTFSQKHIMVYICKTEGKINFLLQNNFHN